MTPAAPTVEELLALIGELRGRNVLLEQENALLRARVAALERRVELDSATSSKPPSSDGPGGPVRRTRSLREKGKRAPGGQPGHPGRTLKRVEQPSVVVEHHPAVCAGCGLALAAAPGDLAVSRQVFDLPAPTPLVVTEHRVYRCACSGCGTVTAGAFPAAVRGPVQYGPRLEAIVAYLAAAQFMPEDRLRQLLGEAFGVALSAGTIGRMVGRVAGRLQGFAAAVCERVRLAPVKHLDETPFSIGTQTQWLHVASTTAPQGLVHYRMSPQRGAVLAGAAHVVVHDHWTSYFQMTGVTHALCNAHHLRELTAAAEIDREPWARRMRRLLRRLCHRVNQARGRGEAPGPPFIAAAERLYDRILEAGLAWHAALPALPRAVKRGRIRRRVGHNLLLRLQQHKAAVLRFLHDPAVPFTNNEAESDIRMMKLRQKISGCFRSVEGAEHFAALRTLIGTARKQGWAILATLLLSPEQLVAKLQHA